MKVALHVNMTRNNAFNVASDVCAELKKLNADVFMSPDLKKYFGECTDNISFIDRERAAEICDVLVAIGGDGAIIHSSHYAVKYDKPILGINAGRLGFLAGLEKQELQLLCNLISGNYTIDSRMMLSVKHYENDELVDEYICFNDLVIARGETLKLCEIEACSEGRMINTYLADGLIAATPTGSTAYSLSAGGPVVDTSIESIILTPVCSHSLFARSMIFRSDTVIQFRVKNPEISHAVFSCDGEKGIPLSESSRLIVTKSEKKVKILRIKSDSFTDILSDKLIERYRHNKEESL